MTHFERLGLPRRFSLDGAALEAAYLARSREVHPDFHAGGDDATRAASLEASAALNEAYATLRDPPRRAEYLLALEGGPSASEGRELPPAFLEEMLDLRMQIEELKSAGPDAPEGQAMGRQLLDRRAALLHDIAAAFERLAGLPTDDIGRAAALAELRRQLNATKYVRGLLRDLRA